MIDVAKSSSRLKLLPILIYILQATLSVHLRKTIAARLHIRR